MTSLRHRSPFSASCLWFTLLVSASVLAQSATPVKDPLAGISKKDLDQAAQHLAQALLALDVPGRAALVELAQSTEAKASAHTKPFPLHKVEKGAPPQKLTTPPMPLAVHYHFGTGLVEATQGAKAQRAEASEHALRLALLGLCPESDRALAALLRDLDADRSADRFAAFLESWKNGDETFYEALDRTAGTKDSVFFYDAMLNEYTGAFAKGKDGKVVLRSLQQAHDALHDSFLAYRQYRAFREAIAWSLVLPPDLPLPETLSRYEAKVEGAFSLREQVAMLRAVHDGDPRKVVSLVTEHAAPLPDPLWTAKYDPYASWNEAFAAAVPAMTERAGNTDAFANEVHTNAATAADAVRAAARDALAHGKGTH